MNKWSKRLTVAAVAGLAMVSAGAAVSYATSADPNSSCPDGAVCLWEDRDSGGSRYVAFVPPDDYSGEVIPLNWWHGAGEISSVANLTDQWLILWANRDGTGHARCFEPGLHIENLADLTFDNDAKSFGLRQDTLCVELPLG